jgi:hypothetical protein
MLGVMRIQLLLVAVALAGCTKHASIPQLPTTPDLAARESAYADAELHYDGGFWGHHWQRADGRYNIDGISPAVDQYPSSKAARKTARNRGIVVGLIGGVGGGLIGLAVGDQLFAQPEEQYSHETRVMLYGGGAALIVVGVLLDQTWAKDAYSEIATSYNEELRRDLALPATR